MYVSRPLWVVKTHRLAKTALDCTLQPILAWEVSKFTFTEQDVTSQQLTQGMENPVEAPSQSQKARSTACLMSIKKCKD